MYLIRLDSQVCMYSSSLVVSVQRSRPYMRIYLRYALYINALVVGVTQFERIPVCLREKRPLFNLSILELI